MEGMDNPPRLVIRKMVLENFKSYAGIQEIGPFHKCFSSIVGPNGSGKSNVIDALLFVFGKRASQIRLKKIAELIHNGSKKKLNMCRVSVHFCDIIDNVDHEDDFEVVEGSEIIISRTADVSSKSTYYINNKTSTFTEVTKLLRTKGVDLDNNRFLILQGEVEQIAMMKPKALNPHENGLLEYLEDIIGSNKYVEDIETQFKEVETLNEQRQEKLNRVKLVEKDKDALEGAKSEAEEYLRKEHTLNSNKAKLYQLYERESKQNAHEVEDKKTQLQAQLDKEREKLVETSAKLDEMEKNFTTTSKEYDDLKSEMTKTKTEFASFERKDIKYREDIKFEKTHKKKMDNKLKKLAKDKVKFEEQVSKGEEDLPAAEALLEELKEEKESRQGELDATFDKLKSTTEPIRIEMEGKQKSMIPLKKTVNKCQQNVSVADGELKLVSERLERAKTQYEQAQTALKQTGPDEAAKRKEVTKRTKELAEKEKRLEKANIEVKQLEEEEKKLATIRRQAESTLEESKSMLAASKSQNAVLSNLMSQKRAGRISGLHGRLGDLGAIDAKYDVAITTACGALNNLVVDDSKSGLSCVEFLSKSKLGRATFIILEKMAYLQHKVDKKISTPENAPRLYDLVRVKDPKYKPAFMYALGDTIVAKDMDQAVRLAYGAQRRWRVVTLDGGLVDTSGTMSGGGNRVAKGGMSSTLQSSCSVSAGDLDRLRKDAEKAGARLQKVREQRSQLTGLIRTLNREIQKDKVALKKLDMALTSLAEQRTTLTARVAELEGSLELTDEEETRISNLKTERKELQQQLDTAKEATLNLEKEIQECESRIMDAGGAKLRQQKQAVQDVEKRLKDAEKAITKIKVDNKAAAKKLPKIEKDVKDTTKAAEKAAKKLEKLKEDLKSIEEDAVKVLEAYNQAQSDLAQKGKELEKFQKEYEAVKKVVEKVRGVEVDIMNRMEDYDRVIKDNNAKAEHWTGKLTQILEKLRACEALVGEAAEADEELEQRKKAQQRKGGKEEVEDQEDQEGEQEEDEKGEKEQEQDQKQSGMKFEILTEEEVAALVKDEITYNITMLEEQLAAMSPNMKAIGEYRRKEQEYLTRVEHLDQTTQERDAARKMYDNLRQKRLDEFMAGFGVISLKLKEMYQMLTLGGDAELDLVDSMDPFSEGIVFSVRPPRKSWKNIQNLSGGEKTLSSLALVFALHHFKPTPLYVMDEIDAALDFKNVSIVGNYIKERTKNAQFVIISLRNNMFELADRLVGIYKTDNATKSISIDPRKFAVPNVPEPAKVESC